MVIPIGVCTPTGPQRGARNPHTLFRVRFSWASLFRWYALKNARVPPAIVLSRLRRGKNGQTPEPLLAKEGCSPGRRLSQTPVCSGRLRVCSLRLAAVAYGFQKKTRGGSRPRSDVQTRIRPAIDKPPKVLFADFSAPDLDQGANHTPTHPPQEMRTLDSEQYHIVFGSDFRALDNDDR